MFERVARCLGCNVTLLLGNEHRSGYCIYCLGNQAKQRFKQALTKAQKRDRLAEEIIEEHSPLKFGYFDSLFPNSNNKINSPNSIDSANPRKNQTKEEILS